MIQHLACIMDGNRRWAQKQGMLPWIGHQKGTDSVKTVIDFCLKKKIPYLSLYTFSLENLNRSEIEKKFLYELLIEQCKKNVDELQRSGVSVTFVGDRFLYPPTIIESIQFIERETAAGKSLHISIMFCYGGRQELDQAAVAFARHVIQSGLAPEDINPNQFKKFLWMHTVPDPELVIRTGGHQRLSNFMPYQSAYSELYFTHTLWPDMKHEDFQKALDYYEQCTRKFGS